MVRGEDGLFRVRGGRPAPVDETVGILSGTLEGSNVNAAEQMVTMISLARQFEMQMKMLSTADANDRAATQILASR
jgi:flagellar basal-body rod protein FlgF